MLNKETISLINQTNSKLTGNLEFVIDNTYDLWLRSINNNPDINKSIFKRFAVDPHLKYDQILQMYFEQDPQFYKKALWDNQSGSLDLFNAGPRLNEDTYFPEKFSYFAPIHLLPGTFPDFFVIFKLRHCNFIQQYIENFRTFFFDELMKSPIVYCCSLKETKVGEFFNNFIEEVPEFVHRPDLDYSYGGYLYGINPFDGNFAKKYFTVSDYEQSPDMEIIDQFPQQELISSNIFNINFLFDADGDNPFCYYGVYLNKEDLIELNINVESTNTKIETLIPVDNYADLDRTKFELEDDNGIKLIIDYPKAEDENIKDIGNGIPTGPPEITDSAGLTGPTGSGESETPTGPSGIPSGVPSGSSGAIETDQDVYAFYGVEDKENNLYHVSGYNEEDYTGGDKILNLVNTNINITDFIGIQKENNLQINGQLLDTEGYANLKLSLDRYKERPVFYNGDYISIKPGHLGNVYEWRVIANEEYCCTSRNFCHYEGIDMTFRTEIFDVRRYSLTLEIEIQIDRIVDFTEGETVIISSSKFNKQPFIIQKISYNHDLNITKINIIDLDGTYFENYSTFEYLIVEYKEPSFDYSYFDPSGSKENVARKMVKAFRTFPDFFLYVTYLGKDIIFRSKTAGDKFNDFILSYNFTKSPTPSSNIFINDIPAIGTTLKSLTGTKLYTRPRGRHTLYGYSSADTKTRFFVDKKWGKDNITGQELISTKQGRIKLQKFDIGGQEVNYTNFLEKYKFEFNKIFNYNNINDFYVYHIKSDSDEILPDSTGNISATYLFNPKFVKLSILDSNDI